MVLRKIQKADIELERTNYWRKGCSYRHNTDKLKFMILRTGDILLSPLKRVRERRNTTEIFNVGIVNNEDCSELLMLVPIEKIRVTPCMKKKVNPYMDKVNKIKEFKLENKCNFYINNRQVELKVLGYYIGEYYVCRFRYKQEWRYGIEQW